jgi:hypothetical protein
MLMMHRIYEAETWKVSKAEFRSQKKRKSVEVVSAFSFWILDSDS